MKTDYPYRATSNQIVIAAALITGLIAAWLGLTTTTPVVVKPEVQPVGKPATVAAPAVVRLPTIVVTAKRV